VGESRPVLAVTGSEWNQIETGHEERGGRLPIGQFKTPAVS
jgi:hypothetical protein